MEPDRITEAQLADALKGAIVTVEDDAGGTTGMLRHPAGIARDVFYLIFRSAEPPAADPAPVRFEDAEVDALAVMVDRIAVLRSETDEVTVQRVIRYLCDRYGNLRAILAALGMPAIIPLAAAAAPGGHCHETAGTSGGTVLICDQRGGHQLHHDPFDRIWRKADGDE